MIFFKHPKVIPRLNLKIAGNTIEQVAEFNFLGINIDQNITWKPHVTKTAIKISRVIGVLNKLKHIFPQHILLTIYNSLIQPHLIYGLYLLVYRPGYFTVHPPRLQVDQNFLTQKIVADPKMRCHQKSFGIWRVTEAILGQKTCFFSKNIFWEKFIINLTIFKIFRYAFYRY